MRKGSWCAALALGWATACGGRTRVLLDERLPVAQGGVAETMDGLGFARLGGDGTGGEWLVCVGGLQNASGSRVGNTAGGSVRMRVRASAITTEWVTRATRAGAHGRA